MNLQTFEQHIEREYRLERKGICLECEYVCWLHNPLLHCKLLEEYLNQSPETKPESKSIAYKSLTAKDENSKNKSQDYYYNK